MVLAKLCVTSDRGDQHFFFCPENTYYCRPLALEELWGTDIHQVGNYPPIRGCKA